MHRGQKLDLWLETLRKVRGFEFMGHTLWRFSGEERVQYVFCLWFFYDEPKNTFALHNFTMITTE